MRYSEILGPIFYKITLPENVSNMIDVFYTGAAHHHLRMKESTHASFIQFHWLLHRRHMMEMMTLIYLYGDFRKAVDLSFRGLDNRESWNPKINFSLPDPNMFNSMEPDENYPVGFSYSTDLYICSISTELKSTH